jgi:GABA permease
MRPKPRVRRLPFVDRETKVEFGAVPLTLGLLGIAFLVYAAAAGGVWWFLVAGALIAAAIVWAATKLAHRARETADAKAPRRAIPQADDGIHRVLVIADAACGPELPALIREHANGRTEVRVLAPVLGSKLSRLTGDEASYQVATAHLDQTVAALREAGIDAEGRVGAGDPLRTADDGLREFAADEIVFALHSDGDAPPEERDLVVRASGRYEIPVSELRRTTE